MQIFVAKPSIFRFFFWTYGLELDKIMENKDVPQGRRITPLVVRITVPNFPCSRAGLWPRPWQAFEKEVYEKSIEPGWEKNR